MSSECLKCRWSTMSRMISGLFSICREGEVIGYRMNLPLSCSCDECEENQLLGNTASGVSLTPLPDNTRTPTTTQYFLASKRHCYFPPTYNGGGKLFPFYTLLNLYQISWEGRGRKIIICVAFLNKFCQISTISIHFT